MSNEKKTPATADLSATTKQLLKYVEKNLSHADLLLRRFEGLCKILLSSNLDRHNRQEIRKTIHKERKVLVKILAPLQHVADGLTSSISKRVRHFETLFHDQLFNTLAEEKLKQVCAGEVSWEEEQTSKEQLRQKGEIFVRAVSNALGGAEFPNAFQEAIFVAKQLPSLKVRTVLRWATGGPITSRKKLMEELIPALKEKKIPGEKLHAIVDAFDEYRKIRHVK